jgi:hypothetical protein
MACSTADIQESEDKSGIAGYTLHHIDDQLYECGEKILGPVIFDAFAAKAEEEEMIEEDGKDGKKKKKKEGKDGKEKKSKKTKDHDEPNVDMGAFLAFGAKKEEAGAHWDKKQGRTGRTLLVTDKPKKGGKAKGKGAGGKKEDEWSGDEAEDDQVNNIPLVKTKGKKKKGKAAKTKGKGDEGGSESDEELVDTQGAPADDQDQDEGETMAMTKGPTPKEMDKLIKESFLNSLKMTIQDGDLPLESGKIWSHHMLLCKPEGSSLDFKLSGYKKLGKFLTMMEKEGYIIYREANKKFPTAQIAKINWRSEKLENYECTIGAPMVKDEWNETSKKVSQEDWSTDITVHEVCVPKKGYEWFFDDFETKSNCTHEEAMKKLDTYLKKWNLINKDSVIINETLSEKCTPTIPKIK